MATLHKHQPASLHPLAFATQLRVRAYSLTFRAHAEVREIKLGYETFKFLAAI